jgi:5-methylcytosine-specific restriction endonuclease McrA
MADEEVAPTARQRESRRYYERHKERILERCRNRRRRDPEAAKAEDARYYQKHRDAKRARTKAYKEANKERVREWGRQWEAANRDRKRELARESYARRREKEIARVVEWTKNNRDKQAAARARRRANVVAAGGVVTETDIVMRRELQQGLCYYCGDSPTRWEVDHFIPLDRGGSGAPENIVMACMPCNRSKGNKLPWERWPSRFEVGCKP